MITENNMFNGQEAKETRLIKSTSKRQITIPKSFFELLALEDGVTFAAQLYGDGVFLKPYKTEKESVRDQDRKRIIHQVFREGHSEEALIEELNYRLKKYDEFIVRRVQEFENDIAGNGDDVVGDGPEADSFNGMDVFFNKEAGTYSEES